MGMECEVESSKNLYRLRYRHRSTVIGAIFFTEQMIVTRPVSADEADIISLKEDRQI